jgi:predicted RND superfamily exporter protein
VSEPSPTPRLDAVFARVIGARWWIITIYALLVPGALLVALRIPKDTALERMVVASNPDVAATREFQRVFPDKPLAVLVVETPEPFAEPAVTSLRTLQAAIEELAGVTTYSVLTVWERMHPVAATRASANDELRRFVSGTPFFRDQGLVGDDFFGIVLALDVAGPRERDATLRAVEKTIIDVIASPVGRAGIRAIRRVGAPWLDSWLEHETGAASVRFFPLFGAFVILLTVGLYRSWRALAAILLSLGVAVLLGVAFGGAFGYGFTLVSALVPLTLMITATASLVYLHSRFVDQPPGLDLEEHRVRALSNKLLAVSASVFAAAVGFAARDRLAGLLHALSGAPGDPSRPHPPAARGRGSLGGAHRDRTARVVVPLALAAGGRLGSSRTRRSDRTVWCARPATADATAGRGAGLRRPEAADRS